MHMLTCYTGHGSYFSKFAICLLLGLQWNFLVERKSEFVCRGTCSVCVYSVDGFCLFVLFCFYAWLHSFSPRDQFTFSSAIKKQSVG